MLMVLSALAAEPVVLYTDPADEALRQVARHTGVHNVEPRRVEGLLNADQPYWVGAEPVERCTRGAGTNADLLRLLGEAEELRLAMQIDPWRDRLDQATSVWTCLDEPADASLGARLHFLRGIAAITVPDELAAAEAFRTARRSDPDLAWDPDFSPDARPVFDRVTREQPPRDVRLQLVPAAAEAVLRVDGRVLSARDGKVTVPAGLHLVQLQDGPTWWLDLADDASLVLPTAVGPALLEGVDDPTTQRDLEALARSAGVQTLYVPGAKRTWEWSDAGWVGHRTPLRRRLAAPLLVGGAAVGLAGVGWMVAETQAGRGRLDEASPTLGSVGYRSLEQQHTAGQTRWTAAVALAASGGVVAGIGGTFGILSW